MTITETETKPATKRWSWTQPICTDCWVLDNSEPVIEDGQNVGMNIKEPTRLKWQDDEPWGDQLELLQVLPLDDLTDLHPDRPNRLPLPDQRENLTRRAIEP